MATQHHDQQMQRDLQRLIPELSTRYGVIRLGYFRAYTSKHLKPKAEINILVELKKPLGWSFFEMKEYIERRLMTRIDVVTSNGLKILYRDQILESVTWL